MNTEQNPAPERDITYTIYIAGTPEQVWQSIVSPEATKANFHGAVLESDFKKGSQMAYVGPGADGDRTTHVYGEILEIEPNKELTHVYNVGDAYKKGSDAYQPSRISYKVAAASPSITTLTIEHTGWSKDDPSYENTKNGWPWLASSMKSWVETGKALEMEH